MSDFQPRIQKGKPDGGRWTFKQRADVRINLAEAAEHVASLSDPTLMRRVAGDPRRAALITEAGFLPPTVTPALTSVDSTDHIETWWAQAYNAMGTGTDDWGHLPQVTPSGKRRYPRMHYRSADISLRMPSRAHIARNAQAQGRPIPVPYTAEDSSGRTITGVALVTATPDGRWIVEAPGLGGESQAKISEAIASVMEGRRAAPSATKTGELIERHKERQQAAGVEVRPMASGWIEGLGYNPSSNTLVMRSRAGALYGHVVDPETARQVGSAYSPGAAYNKLVKGKQERVSVESCSTCNRVYPARLSGMHTCPASAYAARTPANPLQSAHITHARSVQARVAAHVTQELTALAATRSQT